MAEKAEIAGRMIQRETPSGAFERADAESGEELAANLA